MDNPSTQIDDLKLFSSDKSAFDLHSKTSESSKLADHGETTNDVLEDLVEQYIGGSLRWTQVLQVILISMASFFEAQQTFITIFTDAKPSWHCKQTPTTCDSSSPDVCKLPLNSWEWDRPAQTSVISDWSLLCTTASKIVSGLPASSFFMGSLLGGIILGFIGDSIGRKKLLTLSCFTMSAASMLIFFSNNIWVYSGLKAISGLGRAAIGSCVLVLSTESVGKRWRGRVGVVGFLCSTLGYMSLPALAYVLRSHSWKNLYLLTSAPAILYSVLVVLFAYESPKWMLQQGKVRRAAEVLKAYIDPNCYYDYSSFSKAVASSTSQKSPTRAHENRSFVSLSVYDLFWKGDKTTLRQLIVAMLIGFGVGLIYYGTPLGLGGFEFNLYLTVACSATLEVPSALMTFYLAKFRRRVSLLSLCILSGACELLSILVGKWIWMQFLSFFSACTAFNLLIIYTVELFETSVRNSAVSMVWQAIVLGGVISPLVISIGEGYNDNILPHLLFGLLIFILGPLVLLLKETMPGRPQRVHQS
ncbi:OLC1v1029733C1 [Oldenlandia corymbosa var. corymbosa]|uniref:OLC1v1029733C1 n=1 Tax=Oldenlandia corymbosa var. corymbosa TaxID=529605 RepID=A0AAV1CEG7_OLDCO|nr:OLC1v1029733C1 [Oldenlandia corymbosa var. corymbosa]